ncbi:MAG: multifunctional CCA addition/repair protein [Gammaproteobacteria bacterium]|nr:multifunctional CCA addition/repair protein [Gammaproteobacteria bacterium]MBA3730872.1 multifunctional CCA addition/repair protein [Gammaproteobacteria bacterium]
MKIFLVGGAVRDKLMGLAVKERDWVVVGARQADLVAQGYKPVGRDFPVFLHPRTKEEYALARTERKTAAGYRGFSVHTSPDVTLEQDLLRRDLTINALAEDDAGNVIDFYGGRDDLHQRVLRHISPAFAEDPVRILRTARFAARFKHLGFDVAAETDQLMRAMVKSGEADALVPERVWQELVKALSERTPSEFFEVLRTCGALAVIFPELDCLFGVPQPARYHPEIDTGVHTLLVLTEAARLTTDPRTRFAALTHDLGKGVTPREQWPHHYRHEQHGVALVTALCDRLKAPNDYRALAGQVARYHLHCHRALELRPATTLNVLERIDAFRRPDRFEQFLVACEADARGRAGLQDRDYPQAGTLRAASAAAAGVNAGALANSGLKGEMLKQALREKRIAAIRDMRSSGTSHDQANIASSAQGSETPNL